MKTPHSGVRTLSLQLQPVSKPTQGEGAEARCHQRRAAAAAAAGVVRSAVRVASGACDQVEARGAQPCSGGTQASGSRCFVNIACSCQNKCPAPQAGAGPANPCRQPTHPPTHPPCTHPPTNLMQRGLSNEQGPGIQHRLHSRQALRRRAPAPWKAHSRGIQAAGGRQRAHREHRGWVHVCSWRAGARQCPPAP